ncbi:25547_t:CDS:2, partial [Dentiscutata erythropus]
MVAAMVMAASTGRGRGHGYSRLNNTTSVNQWAVAQEINTYREVNNAQISTEDKLDDHQIVKIVLAKQLEYEQGDLDDSDEEPPNILALEGLNRLKNFILFIEQQI